MPAFDVVSELDMQEVTNALDQANRETTTRYDFRDTNTTFELKDDTIVVETASEGRMEAAIDVLQTKFLKRGLSIKALSGGDVKPASGGRVRAVFDILSGIPQDAAKELNKSIKDQKLKVQVQIQGDQLRVQGKKRDDLQEVIAHLKGLDFRVPLQFTNFRD